MVETCIRGYNYITAGKRGLDTEHGLTVIYLHNPTRDFPLFVQFERFALVCSFCK